MPLDITHTPSSPLLTATGEINRAAVVLAAEQEVADDLRLFRVRLRYEKALATVTRRAEAARERFLHSMTPEGIEVAREYNEANQRIASAKQTFAEPKGDWLKPAYDRPLRNYTRETMP